MNSHQKKKNHLALNLGIILFTLIASFGLTKLFAANDEVNFHLVTANAEGNVEISASSLSSKASFYQVEYQEVIMEFFAVKDEQGLVHMALNRCEVCYDSGRGFFIQEGKEFVCQNCGNRYQTIRIGTEKGGCNPSPITNSDFVRSDDMIEIDAELFTANLYLFQ